ncbi:LOW QUALITY PROTEIN: odorant receptor 63a-like [Lucilia cuprina]|uniref:LOW QUALITY PROTEIN: odorant receptor 63a-like n=1 Tax=Lucilia cuprina TaxID=7375 RepID=UPI001F05BEF5|nr:LOW QUALITY PROTEIN: odorant receptor 63a-like [Lucilia cuprina]
MYSFRQIVLQNNKCECNNVSESKNTLGIINILLVICSGISMYGHWCYITRYIEDLTKIAESICTALQTCVSIIKMIYFLFVQRNLYVLLDKAQSHEIIRQSEIFRNDFPVLRRLIKIIRDIMENNWKNIRAQLLFYICSCAVIISNYFFSALFLNMYHQIKGTPNYEHVLPYPSVYPIWESKGMSFPYHYIQMLLCGCANMYIAGMCAVSFDGVFIVLCVHGVGLIEVLNVMIEQSTSSDVVKERRVEYLRNCINLYQNTYEYLLNFSKMYKHISLSQFLLSLVIWGIVLFQMNIQPNKITLVRMVLYLSAAGYEIIFYCYNSQRLTNEYEKIPLAFYNCDCYNESKEFKQQQRMMILRTNRIFNIKISWFTTMSLPTLMIMIKTSGSYFLLLKNLSE